MWTLKSNSGRKIPLHQDVITTVGRRNAMIILENDNSISKIHAKITVLKTDDEDSRNELVCTIMDAGSKYGTYIIGKNDELTQIPTEGHRCRPMDRIRFGLQQHEFTLLYSPSYKYFSLVSRIYSEEKKELSRILDMVNGVLSDEWNPQCTHVTCPTVKLTEKVSCALVAGLYIVTKEYWYALVEALHKKEKQPLPDPADFTPKVDTSILVTDKVSLLPTPARKSLFNGKIFIFFIQNQQELFSRMIELAGGKTIIYDETWKPQDCCQSRVIVVQYSDMSQSSQKPSYQYRSVCLRLSQDKLRCIPDSEIPLAILYCSTQQYCNPQFCYDKLLQPSERNAVIESLGEILAPETQEPEFKHPKKSERNQVIPESVPVDTQISTQMQSQMSLKTRDQITSKTNRSTINRQNVIIPETASMNTETSSQVRSQMSLKTRNQTTSRANKSNLKRNIIPETPSMDTQASSQTQSQMSSHTSQNSITSQKQPLNNGKKNGAKPRMTEVETVVPPVFPQRLMRNGQNSNRDRMVISGPKHSNDLIDDDDSDFESPEKSQLRRGKKSCSPTTTKKRSVEAVSPVLPDNDETNNKKTLAKRRKLDRIDNADIIQSLDNERIETASRENNPVGGDENVTESSDGPSNIGRNVERVPHYFSRNNFDRPKCIIPERLSIDDMYEWKPNRQL